MIQRRQTIFLILAIAALLFFMSVPYVDRVLKGSTTHELLYAKDNTLMMIFSIGAMILAAVAIFMYRTQRRQYLVTMVGLVLNLVVVGILTFEIFRSAEYAALFKIQIGGFLPTVSLIMLLMASRGIIHDLNIIKNSDRLR